MIPIRQTDNCKFGKCYSPSMVRKQRALTIPLLCQINEDGDFNVIENSCNINDDKKTIISIITKEILPRVNFILQSMRL